MFVNRPPTVVRRVTVLSTAALISVADSIRCSSVILRTLWSSLSLSAVPHGTRNPFFLIQYLRLSFAANNPAQ
ncbi:hypothetical protein TNCV_78631 [Trichonephila clavipes]|nr:hypothetical protein TNCV_78631 [Trichonephila clavipes]